MALGVCSRNVVGNPKSVRLPEALLVSAQSSSGQQQPHRQFQEPPRTIRPSRWCDKLDESVGQRMVLANSVVAGEPRFPPVWLADAQLGTAVTF